jgi:hypothetical protein
MLPFASEEIGQEIGARLAVSTGLPGSVIRPRQVPPTCTPLTLE